MLAADYVLYLARYAPLVFEPRPKTALIYVLWFYKDSAYAGPCAHLMPNDRLYTALVVLRGSRLPHHNKAQGLTK